MGLVVPVGAVVDLNGRPYYFHWGVIQISATNFTVVMLMIAVFVAALVLPFPGRRHWSHRGAQAQDGAAETSPGASDASGSEAGDQ